jgi:hypothetical protein
METYELRVKLKSVRSCRLFCWSLNIKTNIFPVEESNLFSVVTFLKTSMTLCFNLRITFVTLQYPVGTGFVCNWASKNK